MTSQELLWINIAIGVLISLIFLMRRAQREPSRLRLLAGKSQTNTRTPAVKARGSAAARTQEFISPETIEAVEQEAPIKSLNVIFNYNGHSWDAYEVLGIPAGAPMNMVNEAFEKALKSSLPESHAFLKTAQQAIEKSKR